MERRGGGGGQVGEVVYANGGCLWCVSGRKDRKVSWRVVGG